MMHGRRTTEQYNVRDVNCPKCGKKAKEIEKALKKGKTKDVSHEDRLKRLKEAGLPTRIEG